MLIELLEFNIKYESRGPLKSQCLADFAVELSPEPMEHGNSWILHVYESSKSKETGHGLSWKVSERICPRRYVHSSIFQVSTPRVLGCRSSINKRGIPIKGSSHSQCSISIIEGIKCLSLHGMGQAIYKDVFYPYDSRPRLTPLSQLV